MRDGANNKLESKVETEPQQASEENTNERVGVLIDELKERTRELEQANRELRRVSHYRSLFLARMSHELRTPLTSMLGFSEILLEQEQLTETQRRFCQKIQDSGLQLQARLNQLVDLSRIEAGQTELFLQEFSMRETLRQILFNFISWAVSRSPADQLVRVFVGLEEPQLCIQISDNGEPLKDIAKVFDPDDTSSSPEANVNELGIIIGRRLIELLTGSVDLRNLDSTGLEVTIKVPARPPKEAEPT